MVPTVIEFLPRYGADVSSFLAGPIEFLNSKKAEENGDAQSRAFVFLLTSRYFVRTLGGQSCCNSILAVRLGCVPSTHVSNFVVRALAGFGCYACGAGGMACFLRSLCVRVRHASGCKKYSSYRWLVRRCGASVVVSATVSLTLVLLLTAAVLYIWWTAGVHSRLIGIVVASTLACGFFSAYFEMASDDRQRISGVFESVLLLATNEYATHTPLQLRVGDRGGRIQPSDPFQDGKHRDIWAYDGRPEQSLCLFIRATALGLTCSFSLPTRVSQGKI